MICVLYCFRRLYSDYGYIINAGKTVSKYLKKGSTVILESTVNPGTCEEVLIPVLEEAIKSR